MATLGRAPAPSGVVVNSATIQDGAVGTADIANSAITNDKVDPAAAIAASKLSGVVTPTYTGDIAITGELLADQYNESVVAITSSSEAATLDLEDGNVFTHTLSENVTYTFSNPPASGTATGFTFKIVQDSSGSGYTPTWPSSVTWPSATAPTLSTDANAVDVLVFFTHDGGTTYYGFTAGQAMGTPA